MGFQLVSKKIQSGRPVGGALVLFKCGIPERYKKAAVEASLSSTSFGFKYQNHQAFQSLNKIHFKIGTLLKVNLGAML